MTDDRSGLSIDDGKRAAAGKGLIEKLSEDVWLVPIVRRMLFPDERIGRHRVESFPIIRTERTKLDELPT